MSDEDNDPTKIYLIQVVENLVQLRLKTQHKEVQSRKLIIDFSENSKQERSIDKIKWRTVHSFLVVGESTLRFLLLLP
jgi:hypothetical protein